MNEAHPLDKIPVDVQECSESVYFLALVLHLWLHRSHYQRHPRNRTYVHFQKGLFNISETSCTQHNKFKDLVAAGGGDLQHLLLKHNLLQTNRPFVIVGNVINFP